MLGVFMKSWAGKERTIEFLSLNEQTNKLEILVVEDDHAKTYPILATPAAPTMADLKLAAYRVIRTRGTKNIVHSNMYKYEGWYAYGGERDFHLAKEGT